MRISLALPAHHNPGESGTVKVIARAVALGAAALAVLGGDLMGQAQCRNLRYRSNFRLNSAQQHLAQAERQGIPPADKLRRLRDAETNLREAARTAGLDELTLWYLYARFHVLNGDLRGADSAWSRAEAAARTAGDSDCVTELHRQRRNERVPIVNAAIGMLNAQEYDSAIVLLRRSLVIYRDDPVVYANMATAFFSSDRADSAAFYFRLAARTGTDPEQAEIRVTSAFNAARLLHGSSRYADAEAAYREYLAIRPRDMVARSNLAAVLTAAGRDTAALVLYDSILADADSIESFELFEIGVALFRQAQRDSANPQTRARKFSMAARAFEAGLERNPYHRDALFNLANTYLAANDTVRAAGAARRLIDADPMNRAGISLLAETFRRRAIPLRERYDRLAQRRDSVAMAREVRARYQALSDSTLRLVQRRDSVPMEFSVQRFEPRDSNAVFRGAMQNLQSHEARPLTLLVEFMNASREIVVTERIEFPALGPGGSPGSVYDFNLMVRGRGIIGYRYRVAN
jgi:thioredoxin-like negative regulator of GroEL